MSPLMSGTELARTIVEQAAKRAEEFTRRTGTQPCLATVLVGDDPASATYVRMKQNRSRKAGIASRHVALPATTTTAELVDTIGSTVRRPVRARHPAAAPGARRRSTSGPRSRRSRRPRTWTASHALVRVDGVRRAGISSRARRAGIIRLLDHYDVPVSGAARRGDRPQPDPRQAGRDAAAGQGRHRDRVPLAHPRPAVDRARRPTSWSPRSAGRSSYAASGSSRAPWSWTPATTRATSVTSSSRPRASGAGLITPVPGGVGPMTIAVLLDQTVDAAHRQADLHG